MGRYIPENNYLDTEYKPIKGFTEDLCTRCEKYYKSLYESGLTKTPFPPTCEKHIQNKILSLKESDFESPQEFEDAAILLDPISWAQAEFGWNARFYQNDMLCCTAKYKIHRLGRRSGKCLVEGTLVATPRGPIAIENIKVGDLVYDEFGKEIKVLNTFNQGEQSVVDLYASNGGYMASCTMDHPWLTRENKVVKTVDLLDSPYITVAIGDVKSWEFKEFRNHRIAQCYDIHVDSPTNLYCLANGMVTHNTEALVIEALHHLVTNKNNTILMVAPYERQVTRFFDEMIKFVNMSTSIKGSLARYTKTPSRMEFNNGSKILGFSAGASSASGSDKIRGADANLIIIDEFDTLEDKDIDAVMAILASHKETKLVAASTPRGWRKKFYNYCVAKDHGFKEFWFIAAESPEWDQKVEDFFKASTDSSTYAHEYLADFAELEEGVFKAKLLNASIQDYDMNAIEHHMSSEYILGVDWNKSAGTHMAIVEHVGGKLKLVRKIIIEESKYTQTEAVELIKTLNRHWRFKYIFADAGYGHVQCELLKKHSLVEPSSLFDQKLFSLAMNQHLDVIDPITGEPIKRNAKHFLIEQTRKLLEDGFLILPKSEDTSISTTNQQMGLVQQMRNFRVEGVSVYGLPRYSQGQDHTLAAYYLACGGYYWKDGDLRGAPYVREVRSVEISDEIAPTMHPSVQEREDDRKKGWKLIRTSNNKHAPKSVMSRSIDLGSISHKRGLNNLKRSMEIRSNTPMPRKAPNDYKRGKF